MSPQILNINNAPVCTSASAYLLPELSGSGTSVANLTGSRVSDKDGDPLTFFILYGNDEALFTVGPTTGWFTVAPLIPGGLSLDFERKSRYLIVVQASDPGGLSCSVEVSVCTLMSGNLLLVWAFRVLRVDHTRPQHVPPPPSLG
jgi:hypothetical protein